MIKNLPLILLVCITSIFTTTNLLAQQTQLPAAQHQVVIETRAFTAEEVQQIQEKLNLEGPFHIEANCPQLGLLVIAVPVSASFRVNTIEEIAISTISSTINSNASVDRNRTAQSVASCSNE